MNAIDFTPFSFTPSQNEETNMYAPVTNFGWFVFFVFFFVPLSWKEHDFVAFISLILY